MRLHPILLSVAHSVITFEVPLPGRSEIINYIFHLNYNSDPSSDISSYLYVMNPAIICISALRLEIRTSGWLMMHRF